MNIVIQPANEAKVERLIRRYNKQYPDIKKYRIIHIGHSHKFYYKFNCSILDLKVYGYKRISYNCSRLVFKDLKGKNFGLYTALVLGREKE